MIILDDSSLDEPFSSVCGYCKHLLGPKVCRAFPKGIPAEIWNGDNAHTSPYPGDNGVQFEEGEAVFNE